MLFREGVGPSKVSVNTSSLRFNTSFLTSRVISNSIDIPKMLLADLFKLWDGALTPVQLRGSLTHKSLQNSLRFPLRRRINDPEDDTLPGLAVEDGRSRRRGEDERDDRKILLTVDEDHPRRITDHLINRVHEFVGDRARGFFAVILLAWSRGERVQGVRIV